MIGALLALAGAALFGGLAVAAGVRARSALKGVAPPAAALLIERANESAGGAGPALIMREIDSERRAALQTMELLLLRFRSAARIALAAGTGSALLALADELGQNLQRALLIAWACFALGGLATAAVAQLGHLARRDCRRFRDDWNTRLREATRALEAGQAGAEWTDPGGAG